MATKRSDGIFEAGISPRLARLDHPDALEACLQALDGAPDDLHADITPAVTALSGMGARAVPPLLDRLTSPDSNTRLHAQRALEMIVDRRYGFEPGRGFPTPEAEEKAREEWRANGDYDYRAASSARALAV